MKSNIKLLHIQCLYLNEGEITLNLPKIVITSIVFLELKYLVNYRHHILDYFYLF